VTKAEEGGNHQTILQAGAWLCFQQPVTVDTVTSVCVVSATPAGFSALLLSFSSQHPHS
jgi:hypothetical protein